ncbi:MerR family transcriptional regulator, partial [Albidovulum sp.]|uniref:MerR family transcriptional regulator n=1 Tax=Albidovulum sp. TaxID=1872424 RepID=UPI0039B9A28E
MEKSPEAFRTISEVADLLDTPAHVLRFWESRFSQVRPVKRAGGRRYYRPADLALLGGIRKLLHDDGMTIRGVQKILREKGVRHVAALGAAEAPGRPAAPAAAAPEPAPDPAPVPAP